MIEYRELQKILPQAYPFVLIDRVEEFTSGVSLVAVKNITANEWVYENAKQDIQNYPETLLIEAAAQAALVLYRVSDGKSGKNSRFYLGKTRAEFFNPCSIGDQVKIKVIVGKIKSSSGHCKIEVNVNNNEIMRAQFIFRVS